MLSRRTHIIRIFNLHHICILMCPLFLLFSCHRTPKEEKLTLLFTGDVLLDRGIRPLIERYGIRELFKGVEQEFRRADAVIINLECPLTRRITPLNKQFIFRAEPEWAKGLRQTGITHASLANNHTNDQGRQGLSDTYRALRTSGIIPLGYGCTTEEQLTPAIIRKGRIEVAVFSAVFIPLENWTHLEGQPGVCQPSIERLSEHIRQYRTVHPSTRIVACLHWGAEHQTSPHMQQRYCTHRLLEAGADAIIGHHPHVVQPLEYIGKRPVFYSLGNFVFDQSHPLTQRSLMAVLQFSSTEIKVESIPIEIQQCKPQICRK